VQLKVTYTPAEFVLFTTIQGPTPNKAVMLIQKGESINTKESAINFRRYKGSL